MNQKHLQHLYSRAGFGLSYNDYSKLNKEPKSKIISGLFSNAEKWIPLLVDVSELKALSASKKMNAKNSMTKMSAKDKRDLTKKSQQKIKELNYAWIKRLEQTNAILNEKMTLFWTNTFVCKDNNILHIMQYNNTLRKHALGNFRDFVKAIAREPSMSKYLNNKQNVKKNPNENFARELMELFTLGIDNYTENDIKEAARAFTGWSFNENGGYKLRKKQHDYGIKTFLGKTGDFNGDAIIDIILEQENCARFICRKLYSYFVNPKINEERINELTSIFFKNYDIKALMLHVFSSDWFYAEEHIGVKIKSPIELLVGIQKIVPVTFQKEKQLLFLQKMMGQTLLNPPNVAGWKGDKNWIDSNTLLFRLKLPSLLLNNAVINLEEKGEFEDRFETYYKKEKKKKQYLKVTKSWIDFDKEYGTLSVNELKVLLIVSKIDKDTEQLLSHLALTNNRDFLIQLMSIPEYQLC